MRLLGITLGDLNGIGPEVALKAAYGHRWPSDCRIILIGNRHNLQEQAERFDLPVPPEWDPKGSSRRKVFSWDPAPELKPAWHPGRIRPDAARLAVDWIRLAVEACMSGRFHAMITAPICKEGLKKAGLNMPGHTEFLAELTGTKRFAMMLMGDRLRVVLVTRHIPLREVAASITRSNIIEAIQITHEALPWLGLSKGHIGVCGLNPHAGDGGAIGREEIDIISPAVHSAARKGMPVEGPIPPDVIFHQVMQGAYDAVVAMYHDQGLGPLKMLSFDTGINVTLGLPIVRTSPDHGTAFGIAGKNKANPGSMIAAIELAYQLAGRKNPWQRKRA